ncbi:type III pantothenate kinase [Noviherbaspirillum sedimenti]|uniref:Type III pantothenate kinase n=1 Tax=Noviherbaspirillum sedimenti TaxID=2320865 RepID=A0A3A3G3S5_9BURK|nr:type III pantothenate kinase [Noviherbaspirillum sedimenti]RJG03138.1 type III pantothenate kinase [Noviherbaspirillum sedimenti]
MLLLVDAGNTRIKWALMQPARLGHAELGHWSGYGSVRNEDICQMADAIKGEDISRVLISNVAGAEMRAALERMALRALGMKPVPLTWFASQAELAGVRNGYRDPAQLGCDRFAALIGARALFPGVPLLVATCGTATTVDALDADGRFRGGMILPGLGLMASSLARNTAQLPQVPQYNVGAQPFADNTHDAIASGCIAAQAGAIGRALAAHAALLEEDAGRLQCILSGGAAGAISPHLPVVARQVDNLVLIGLQAVLTLTQSPC